MQTFQNQPLSKYTSFRTGGPAENLFIIEHTEVSPDFNGKGVGKKMVLAAVDFARKENKKIIPLCPFAKATFDKNEELRDVLS